MPGRDPAAGRAARHRAPRQARIAPLTSARLTEIAPASIPAPGLITLAPVYLCLGAMFGTIDLSTVDFAQEHGHKPLAGFILGAYALGSAVGGLWLWIANLA